MAYPEGATQVRTVDVQVVRSETHITLTNTTDRSFGAGRVWANRRFSRDVDGFAIGETLSLDLREFRDEFDRRFRAGGFFATRSPKALVQFQYEEAGRAGLVGFVVVPGGVR